MRRDRPTNMLQVALLVALALVLGACDADSPTAPAQRPSQPVSAAGATTAFAIQVSLDPNSIEAGSGLAVEVTIVARRTDNNQFVPRNSTASISTTSGTLADATGAVLGNSGTVTFGANGTALATLTVPTQTAVISAQISDSIGQATLQVTEAPAVVPFSIQALVPNFGPPTGGTIVRIEGSGFSLVTEVTFDGVSVEVLSVSSSVIQIRTPEIELAVGSNRAVSVTVNINVGDADAETDTLSGGYTYTRNASLLTPKIISITPTSGPNEGGTLVTLFGEAFPSEPQVIFGSSRIEATVTDIAPSRILVLTPSATGQNAANLNQTVAVSVTDLNSGFTTSLPGAFQYGSPGAGMFISSVAPVEGTYFGGTLVTIFGNGFEAPVAVEFGGRAQQPVSVSGTEIVARSIGPVEIDGCGRPSGSFLVVNIETNEPFTSSLTFTYRPVEPQIGSVSPSATTTDVDTGVIVAGPTVTTITGAGFDRQVFPPEVTFAGNRSPGVTITSLDADPFHEGHGVGDVMLVSIPEFRAFAEEECTSGTDTGSRFVPTDVNVIVTARDTGCADTLTAGFTYIPSDGSCRIPPPAP